MEILVVVDMQNDFIDGSLGTKEAVAIVPKVVDKMKNFNGIIFATRDTHQKNYLNTQEGTQLPVCHCIENTAGWQLCNEVAAQIEEENIINKNTFGSVELGQRIKELSIESTIERIVFVGLCTDICVISNAMLVKAYVPEVPLEVDSFCCAGVTPESHEQALSAMRMCQVKIV